MPLATLKDLKSPKGKRVLLRVDFNVPLGPKGEIGHEEDARIRAALPTIQRLRKAGARVIIVSHLGRPEGREAKYSLRPVAEHLAKLLDKDVPLIADGFDEDRLVDKKIAAMKNGDVSMLENIRFYKGEDSNGSFLARRLASFADVYVDDAFAVAHREAASNVGVTKHLPSYAGLLLETEVKHLDKLLGKPKKPFVVLMGGAKISSKLPTLKKLLAIADTVMVGGGMANNFFRAMGLDMGRSLVAPEDVKTAKGLLARHKHTLLLPKDVLVATRLDDKAEPRYCRPGEIRKDEHVVDLGAETIREWAAVIKKARTIVWNGPVGLFEVKKFSHGSISLGRMVAARSSGKAFGVVGGGETVQCLLRTGMEEYVDHVSTGGGAMLEYLAGKSLPGIKPLMKRSKKK
ncbi:MAG TPA: phosphoglycerate kinase [Candidatus Eisenbacteria bacterium]|jgi:phosphoglycerate kinase|nr:phosphoglycerate kinase [Candidatus Eisenbacteria bacterium]